MKKYNGNLGASLEVQHNSIVGYGPEFRDVNTLHKIFGWHPNWTRMPKIPQNGSEWHLETLDEELRHDDINAGLAFRNHKGASLQPKLLQKLVSKDVHFGYCPPLPLDKAQKIPGVLLALMNIQKQDTINKHGRIVKKDHLTQNQSYKWPSGMSVNIRVITEELLPCMLGACIKRGPSPLDKNPPKAQSWHPSSISSPPSEGVTSMQRQQRRPAPNLLKSTSS